MNKLLVVVFILCFVYSCKADCDATTFLGGKFQRCRTLNSEYDFYWTVDGDSVTIALNLRGYTNPWVGLGISINGGMMGGDIALAQYIDGAYTLEDRFATQFARPQLDSLQNLDFISGSCVNGNTIIIYKRKLVSCDVDQDQNILANATQVIYAYGTGPFDYHGPDHHGTVVVYFHYVPQTLVLPSNYSEFNVTFPAYVMPAQETTYACVSAVLPADTKYHIIRWRPIIKNPANIHHMVLFGCYYDPNTPVPYECGMAPSASGCGVVIIAWTIGQQGDDFVGDYAIPFGQNVAAGMYVVLQIHYNNPTKLTGVVDQSGVSITYTPILRTNDVGTVPMSVPWQNHFLVLPPGQQAVQHYTRCHSECTSKGIPAEGINIINWFPHMHQLGSKIWLSHVRNGNELPEIHRDNHYDFLRQQNFPVFRTIYPGDSLIMNCIWDTSAQTQTVYGGESTSEEMCIGIFQYYPAQKPPTFTRCTDMHEYFNTSGNDLGYSVCNQNNITVFDPVAKKNISATPVWTNPAFVALPPVKSTCPATNPSSSASKAILYSASLLLVVLCMLL